MEILLNQIRINKGFTLEELAQRTGKSTLNNYENGITSPELFKLEKIAIALNVRRTDLFESEHK